MNLFLPINWQGRWQRWLLHNKGAKIVTLLLFGAVWLAVGVTLFIALQQGFMYVNQDSALGQIATFYAYQLFMLILSLLSIASTVITALFMLFRRPQDTLILASPAFPQLLFTRTREIAISSSWPLLLFLIPALLALRSVFGTSVFSLAVAAVGLGMYSLFLSLATLCIIFICALSLGKQLRFGRLAALLASSSFLVVAALLYWSHSGNLFSIDSLAIKDNPIAALSTRFHLLPSSTAAELLYHLQQSNSIATATDIVTLLAFLGVSLLLFSILSRSYLPIWQQLQEGGIIAQTKNRSASHQLNPLLKRSRTPLQALAAKEILLLLRDRQQLAWLLFLFGMWAVQAVLVSGITKQSNAGSQTTTIQLIEFLITVYFTSTAVLRFVYPTFSMERRSAWLLASAPIDLRSVLIAKAAWFTFIFSVFSCAINTVSLQLAGANAAATSVSVGMLLVAVITLVSIGIFTSVFFANFETDDPQVLSTSLPGLGLILVSLLYGAGSTLILRQFLSGNGTPTVVWAVISLLFAAVMYKSTLRRAQHLVFIKNTF